MLSIDSKVTTFNRL